MRWERERKRIRWRRRNKKEVAHMKTKWQEKTNL
jgi:hypothetical protein